MVWLRSEDLKEEKVLITSQLTITRQRSIYLSQIDLLTVSARPSSCGSTGRIQAQSQKWWQLANERVNPGPGEQVRCLLVRQNLTEPNQQVSPFAFEILYKIAHSISGHFGRDLF